MSVYAAADISRNKTYGIPVRNFRQVTRLCACALVNARTHTHVRRTVQPPVDRSLARGDDLRIGFFSHDYGNAVASHGAVARVFLLSKSSCISIMTQKTARNYISRSRVANPGNRDGPRSDNSRRERSRILLYRQRICMKTADSPDLRGLFIA